MARSPFDPDFDALPAELPIFPLPGGLLLPGGRLPLNIFEPRYLAMTADALQGERLIGMVQPRDAQSALGAPEVYDLGCVGRITAFSETEDGRYLVTLDGLIRFRVAAELPQAQGGYRRVEACYEGFRDDLLEQEASIDRPALISTLRSFFDHHGIKGDWDTIEQTGNERLVTSLAMLCPFSPSEKQALLEAPGLAERAASMIALLQLASFENADQGAAPRH
ncbi:MAG: LON peptidase substrate-binding domain-containing protein [Rhodospirillales bacterium]